MGHIPVAKPSPIPRWTFPRSGLAIGFILSGLVTLIAVVATTAYPTGSKIDMGPRWETVADAGALQANAPVPYRIGTLRLWIVKLDSGEVLALSARDPHPHGCNIAWRPDLETAGHRGWFRELCLGSTYSLNGVKGLGPSPRGMDRYETRVYGDDVQIYLGPKTLIEGSGDLAPYFSGR